MENALVLGAGGITGIAWHLGVLTGLRAAGVDLTGADLVVGTSAGSVTGALLTAGLGLEEARRMEARLGDGDPPIEPDWEHGSAAFAALTDDSLEPATIRRTVGRLALAATVMAERPYVASLARRLPRHDWPVRPFVITAVDAESGEPVAWDRDSGVPLDLAVAASCAVPAVFPPVTVGGRRYMDGGVRSGTNADLAAACGRIVVLAPLAPIRMHGAPAAEIEALRQGSKVALVAPDDATLAALGPNVFDAGRWEAAIEAGIAQGSGIAAEVAAVWHS